VPDSDALMAQLLHEHAAGPAEPVSS
jgi:hypothetical protein